MKSKRSIIADETGAETGGQSGDTQGLPGIPGADSESVKELVEEGQYFEAAVVSGVENALDPDVAEVTTREVPQDEIPGEEIESPNADVQ
jgi:hypothetical protein